MWHCKIKFAKAATTAKFLRLLASRLRQDG